MSKEQQILKKLQNFQDQTIMNWFRVLPELLKEAENKGDYNALRDDLLKTALQRYGYWKNYHDSEFSSVREQIFENDARWGEVGELVDFWKTKQTGLIMERNPELKKIDFTTPFGLEDTKWSIKPPSYIQTAFPIELKSGWNRSHHWKYLDEGKSVFLRYINWEGCWRIKLEPEMETKKGANFSNVTNCYWCPKENFEKVWSW